SRVPAWWSTIPTTMNSAALNSAWARTSSLASTTVSGVPRPNNTTMKPSWLTVPYASSSLRPNCTSPCRPPATIVPEPTATPDGHQERTPEPHVGEGRGHAPDEVDAGLHHGGGVQVGADRRGGHHRARQPGVERVLRRLRERAGQHQHEGDGHDRAVGRRGQDL